MTTMKENATTVLIVDDHHIVREGLRLILDKESDIDIVGTASNGREAINEADRLRPKIVIMDIVMPLLNGLEATRQIMKTLPAVKVLIISAHNDDEYIERALNVGAVGYLVKNCEPAALINAVREINKNNSYFSPCVSNRIRDLVRISRNGGSGTFSTPKLTIREAEVLQMISEGFANKEMASHLDISVKTIEKHRQQIMNKLKIHTIAGLTTYAITRGITKVSTLK